MPELSNLLHRSADDITVPHPPGHAIVKRGRSLRRRRQLATGVVAAVTVLAAGVGGALLTDNLGNPRGENSDVVDQHSTNDPVEAYREWGAWLVGDQLTVGRTTVRLSGSATYLAQTSVGVVAQTRGTDSESSFVLVRPDGSQSPLAIPSSTLIIKGDIGAPRVAWVDDRVDALELHVWDVVADQEVGRATIPAPGTNPTRRGEFLTQALLDQDHAYVGVGTGGQRVNWRTGSITPLSRVPFSVRNGVLAAPEKDGWSFTDTATSEQISAQSREFASPLLSPDGRFAATIRSTETESWIGVSSVADGAFTEIPDFPAVPVWTPGGRMLSFTEDGSAVVVCTISGDCEEQDVDVELAEQSALLADYLSVG